MGFRRQIVEAPRVELTPMIDVVFLLLIFFMISTTFIEKPGLMVDLPESTLQQVKPDNKEVHVYLTAKEEIYLNQELVTADGLAERLSTYSVSAKQMTFLLMADKDALHGSVVALMDLAKTAGFGKLAIATDKSVIKPEEGDSRE